MPSRYPIDYDLDPRQLRIGAQQVTLRLLSSSSKPLTALVARLDSLDVHRIRIRQAGHLAFNLEPGQDQVLAFEVTAVATTGVYITLDGWQDGRRFHWESPFIVLVVGEEKAQLVGLLALAGVYPFVGKQVECQALVRGLVWSRGLRLAFSADTPGGRSLDLETVDIGELHPGEDRLYTAELTLEEKGPYVVHAHLYDGKRRIGHETDQIDVRETHVT